ncbi:tetratricopeptide repeat protein [Saccharothrix australiensis]|uniref:Tetratricopeptide repeat protein n=1 Tax=Saccharothrix australiensis TaxID=2072 RepID=A0A495VXD3_9PSEU|nr:tetratricopeptide repeat protein [Saccharothrix australiensis]RKT53407.1 tetratricopeptide repeat protein [Saccharothrix australiensis]
MHDEQRAGTPGGGGGPAGRARGVPPAPLTSVAPPLKRLTGPVRGRADLVAAVTAVRGGAVAVLCGAGGFGKTTVALEVVRGLPDVWWVDASSAGSLSAGLAEVALQAGADPTGVRAAWSGGGGSAIELLWRHLDHLTRDWVLVLDGADDPRVLAADGHRVGDGNGWLRTPDAHGTILVTSRASAGWPPDAKVFPVRGLPPADGARVLLDLADAGSAADAEELSRRLGGLPLALRVAGSYLAVAASALALPGLEAPTTFRDYRARWEERFAELADDETAPARESPARTWEMSVDLLADRGRPQARPLLRLLSTFADAPVPAFLLDATVLAESGLLPGVTAARLSVLLRALQEVGLLDVVAEPAQCLLVHPVIREANRHRPDYAEHRARYRGVAVDVLARAVEPLVDGDPAAWPRWHLLLPHVAALAPVDDPARDLAAAALLSRGADFCAEVGRTAVAESLYRRSIALGTAAAGVDHWHVSSARHALGHVLKARGDPAGAERELRALAADQAERLGAADAATLNTRNCLARAVQDQGRWDEAEAEYRQVLAERERVFGPTSPAALSTRHDLAHLLEDRGDLAGAEAEQRVVLAALRRRCAEHDAEVVSARSRLADLLRRRGRWDEAEAELVDLLALSRSVRGAEHPDTLGVLLGLAALLRERRRVDDAERHYRDLLAACTRVFGPEHPRTLTARHGLAHLCQERDDPAGAEAGHRAVLAIQERTAGAGDPATLRTRSCLARLLVARRRFAEAEREFRAVLEHRERAYGPRHLLVLAVRHQLAHVAEARGDLAAAEAGHRAVLADQSAALGPLHPETLMSHFCLAGLLRERGRPVEAEAAFRATVELETRVYGAEHANTLVSRRSLAGALADLGRHEEALDAYREVLAAQERTLGADHPQTARTRDQLAALRDQGGAPA